MIRSGDATAEDLLAGVMKYAAERTGQEERYTKHATTWLHQGCWNDEPLGARAGEVPLDGGWPNRPAGHRDIRTMSNLEIALAGLAEDSE